jgi:D-aminoacyl-tRNA deacylase
MFGLPGLYHVLRDCAAAAKAFSFATTGVCGRAPYARVCPAIAPKRVTPAIEELLKVLLQRVARAEVTVGERSTGRIGKGLLLLVGFTHHDSEEQLAWLSDRILGLRIFPDDEGKMNRSVIEAGGALLVVSQFTLYGDTRKGRRPSFVDAAAPDVAIPLYERFTSILRASGLQVETGEFGAMMQVDLVNDGPVTLMLER